MKDNRIAALARRLPTVHSTDFRALRAHVLTALVEATGEGAAFDRRVIVDGAICVCDGQTVQSHKSIDALHDRLTGIPNVLQGVRGRRGVSICERDRRVFLESAELSTRAELEESHLFQTFFRPLGIADQLRFFPHHGRRMLGWVGFYRMRGEPYFTRADARRLQPLVEPLTDVLAAAQRLQDDASQPADLVVHPNGRVSHSTASARPWLERESFRTALRMRIRALDASQVIAAQHSPLDSAEARIVRLDGAGGGVRYLVNVTPAPLAELAPSDVLGARERETALAAAAGETAEQIARARGVSAETVRAQLKAIYRKLGVGSRIELADALRRPRGVR